MVAVKVMKTKCEQVHHRSSTKKKGSALWIVQCRLTYIAYVGSSYKITDVNRFNAKVQNMRLSHPPFEPATTA
ncbi:hypothetical protein BC936DRAFT_146370 [Jimgerdemannia flammicorona]|uniref:Uncharacterized protein n=1 Tax=Jimgerdemannia flammicorona TaxID=994334 RepID=A0A433D8I6_9FUNG|nr:hypothetical protein BC936DRAFT_146370 [Jimgerdemannia flammicorona]